MNKTTPGNERKWGTRPGKLYIGTSGWTYADWKGRFFPGEITKKSWLEWYSRQFTTTEINGSFYRMPSREAVRAWADSTPRGFRFAWKEQRRPPAVLALWIGVRRSGRG